MPAEPIPVAWWGRVPARRTRLVVALALGALAAGVFLAHATWGPDYVRGKAGDLSGPLEGARRILAGQRDIYATPYAPYASAYPLSYPLTTSFALLPLALVPPPVAGLIFTGATTALAAYLLSRRRLDDLLLFLSAPAFFSWAWAQWAPLLLLQGLAPWTIVLGLAKPQVGVALFAYRPGRRGLALAAGVGLATLLWSPTWPLDWLRGSLRDATEVSAHAGALFAPGGVLLLAAFWRWRDPRARLLLALAIIPNRLWFYDQLYLGLVPETTRRKLTWVLGTWLAAGGWLLARHLTGGEATAVLEGLIVALVYGPALFFILRPAPAETAPPATPDPARSNTTTC
ncbi:MAG: hypothetical protein RLZZ15_1066 [Verrucomicrobiota bacterium]